MIKRFILGLATLGLFACSSTYDTKADDEHFRVTINPTHSDYRDRDRDRDGDRDRDNQWRWQHRHHHYVRPHHEHDDVNFTMPTHP